MIVGELRKLVDEPMGDEELQRTKDYAAGSFRLSLETPMSLGQRYGNQLLMDGEIESPEDTVAAPRAVTAEEIQQVAKRVIGPGIFFDRGGRSDRRFRPPRHVAARLTMAGLGTLADAPMVARIVHAVTGADPDDLRIAGQGQTSVGWYVEAPAGPYCVLVEIPAEAPPRAPPRRADELRGASRDLRGAHGSGGEVTAFNRGRRGRSTSQTRRTAVGTGW